MTPEEPSRLGIYHLLADADVRDSGERRSGFALEVKFDGFLEVRDCFRRRGAEAGDVHVEALRDVELILAMEAVGDLFHSRSVSRDKERLKGAIGTPTSRGATE